MNSTLLKKYETIDQSKVSEKDKKVLEQVKKLTNGFEETDEAKNKVAEKILDQITTLNPDAVKKPQVVAEKVAKVKKVAKAKKVAKSKKPATNSTAKGSGNNIMSVAKEIQKAGESWKDAMERAKQVLKERKEKVVEQKKTELEKLYALVKTKKELQGFAKSDIRRDAVRSAKPRGARVVTKEGTTSNQYGTFSNKLGRKYWETRDRHADRLAPNYPKDTPLLAKGGGLNIIFFQAKNKKDRDAFFEEVIAFMPDHHIVALGDLGVQVNANPTDILNLGKIAQKHNVEMSYENGGDVLKLENELIHYKSLLRNIDKYPDYNKKNVEKIIAELEAKIANGSAGQKKYQVQYNVGKVKYLVSFHDGIQKHKDGSNFYEIRPFNNKKDLEDFLTKLSKQGYREMGYNTSFDNGGMFEAPIAKMKEVKGKTVSVPVNEEIYSSEINEFVDYVDSFYGKKGVYAEDLNGGFTKAEIRKAVNKYIENLNSNGTWGGGDSLDRERVRQILQPLYKMADGGTLPFMTDPNFGNFQNTGMFEGGGSMANLTEQEFIKKYWGANVFTENPSQYFEIKKMSSANDDKVDAFVKELKADGFTVKKRAYSDFTSVMGVKKKTSFELGGEFMTNDLAGHTGGGTGGLNAGMPLDGFSNTHYTGLVGETGAMSSGELFEAGGAMAQNQQVINDASQPYVITEAFGNPAQHLAKGGAIVNQYEGRTPEDVWDNLTQSQRLHFLTDHNKSEIQSTDYSLEQFSKKKYRFLSEKVKKSFNKHISTGQYASGGSLGKALYVAYSSYFDSNKYDEEKIMSVLKSIGAKNIHLENDGGMSNQPEVVVFNGSKRQAEDALNEAFDTDYILIYEKDWRTKKMADGGSVGDDFEEVIDLGSEQYYKRPFGTVETDSKGEVELVAVATIKDLEEYMPEEDLPEEGNFQLDITLVPTEEFISEEMLENANDEDSSSISDDSVVNLVNYTGGLNYTPQERVFFESHQDALDYLMSKELKDKINSDAMLAGFVMDRRYNRAGQDNWGYLDYLMGVTDRFAKGGFVGTVEFNVGDTVWQKDEKRYATVMNNYGDPINGDGGELRLDTTGNTNIFTYNKKYDRTGYNLVKAGEKGDTGKFTPKVLDEMKESANRLIDSRKKSKDKGGVAYYEEVYKRLLDGEFDSMANGTAKLSKYIDHDDIESVTLNVNGNFVTFAGKDFLNGANLMEKGGDLSKIATYFPKRDIVKVTLKNGETIKPLNGYWLKKGSEPIKKTGTNGGDEDFKIGDYVKRTEKQGSVTYGTQGFIYEINKDFSEIKLEDDYGNKNPKSFKLKGFRKLKSKSKNTNVISNTTAPTKMDANKLLAPKGYVFVNSASHRATQQINRADVKYISLYSFGSAKTSAGTSIMFMSEKDFEKIKNIKGVSPAKNYLSAKSQWFSRREDKNLDTIFRNIEQKESFANGGMTNLTMQEVSFANGGDTGMSLDPVKARVVLAVGLDSAIEFYDADYPIRPYQLLERAVRGGYIALDEINERVVDSAMETAEDSEDMEEVGSSDFTAYFHNFLRDAGFKVGYVSGRLTREYADGGELQGKFLAEIKVPYNYEKVVKDEFEFTEFLSKTLTKKWFGNGIWGVKMVKPLFEKDFSQKIVVEIEIPVGVTQGGGLDKFEVGEFISKTLTKKWFGNGIWGVDVVSTYANGGMFDDNDGFMKADNNRNFRYPEMEVNVETFDEPIDLTGNVSVQTNEVVVKPLNESIDLNYDNRVRARMGYNPADRTPEKMANINPRMAEFVEFPKVKSNTHKNNE